MSNNRLVEAPPAWMTALESRAALELASWRLARPLLERMPPGDGHPVLVLPGFTAADRSTAQLRALLRRLGYRTYGWGLGANLGPTPKIVDGLEERIDSILQKRGEPMSIVGWSLGGIYARLMSREHPDAIRQVITLGSPFRMQPTDRSAVSGVWDSLSPMYDHDRVAQYETAERPPLPVPATSIYSRTDGIVYWRTCLETKSDKSENIEVWGSHCGLAFNPSVAFAVANRLAQPADRWKRFRPPLWAMGAYPRPANHKPR